MLRSGCSNEPSFLGVNALSELQSECMVMYMQRHQLCTIMTSKCVFWLISKSFAFHLAQVGKIIKAGCQWMKTKFVLMNMIQKQTAALITLTQHILPFNCCTTVRHCEIFPRIQWLSANILNLWTCSKDKRPVCVLNLSWILFNCSIILRRSMMIF